MGPVDPMGMGIARLVIENGSRNWNGWMGMGGNENPILSHLPLTGS